MHLHIHLADCIFDYGPVCGFWLFGFEHYNGILGEYYTNNKSIELQLMRKFTKAQVVLSLEFPDELSVKLKPLLDRVKDVDHFNQLFVDRGTVLNLLMLCDGLIDLMNEPWYNVDAFSFGLPHTTEKLDIDEFKYLTEVYQIIIPEFAGELYGLKFPRLNRSSFILAKWADRQGCQIMNKVHRFVNFWSST